MPNPDEHDRGLIYTECSDFNGEFACTWALPEFKFSEFVGEHEAPFTCKYCGRPIWIDPSDQSPPPDYCHEIDHGTSEDRAVFGSGSSES